MPKRIEFVETRGHRAMALQPDRWLLRPKGRLARAWGWLFAQAKKRGMIEPVLAEGITYTRHVVEPDNVIAMLFAQQREIMQQCNLEATRVLMGSEDYAKLMSEREIMQYITFTGSMWLNRGSGPGQVIGLDITIVPWMRGIVVLP